jgi:hypothetical protein
VGFVGRAANRREFLMVKDTNGGDGMSSEVRAVQKAGMEHKGDLQATFAAIVRAAQVQNGDLGPLRVAVAAHGQALDVFLQDAAAGVEEAVAKSAGITSVSETGAELPDTEAMKTLRAKADRLYLAKAAVPGFTPEQALREAILRNPDLAMQDEAERKEMRRELFPYDDD